MYVSLERKDLGVSYVVRFVVIVFSHSEQHRDVGSVLLGSAIAEFPSLCGIVHGLSGAVSSCSLPRVGIVGLCSDESLVWCCL